VIPVGEKLLRWFDENKRELPWRRSREPYRVWISEVMLQQTRVERVVPYFESFLSRFPEVDVLAAASIDDVLSAWSGLGYYRRARHLHAAARQIVAQEGFPREIGGWMALPGVGPYTAAAITSIAFGVKAPVLDGNVERVLSRLLALQDDPKRARARRRLLEVAESLLDDERPGDSNQALMELGATLCTPRSPQCRACPLAAECVAFESDRQEEYPVRGDRRKIVRENRLAVVVERNERVLLFRRPENETVLGGLWEIPWTRKLEPRQAASDLSGRYGGGWSLDHRVGRVRHVITFRDLRVEVWTGNLMNDDELRESSSDARWFRRERLDEVPLSTLVTKILEAVTGG
jgi:A/G-specific adenine glycosylase